MRCSIANGSLSAGGISFEDSHSSTVTNCSIGSIKGIGIKVLKSSNALWIAGNRIEGRVGGIEGTGILLGVSGAHVVGNTIESLNVGIELEGGRGYFISGYFEGTGVAIRNKCFVVDGLHVSGCIFSGPQLHSEADIELRNIRGAVIQGNHFVGLPAPNGRPAPIRITSGGVVDSIFGPNSIIAEMGVQNEDQQVIVCSSVPGGCPGINCSITRDPADSVTIYTTDGLGIGKNDPSERLDVEGNIKASGTIQAGSITIDGASEPGTMHVFDNASGSTNVKIRNANPGPNGNANARMLLERGVDYGASEILFQTAESKTSPQTTDWRSGVLRRGGSSNRSVAISTQFDINATEPEFAIDTLGRVGIGTSSPSNILTVVQNSATDPIADAWTEHSSRRWKTNVKPLDTALEKVKRLRGVSFDWKESGKHDIGLIAEEVGKVVPEVVAYEENGQDAKSINYARLTALLVEAVKTQQVQIEALRKQATSLEAPTGLGD